MAPASAEEQGAATGGAASSSAATTNGGFNFSLSGTVAKKRGRGADVSVQPREEVRCELSGLPLPVPLPRQPLL